MSLFETVGRSPASGRAGWSGLVMAEGLTICRVLTRVGRAARVEPGTLSMVVAMGPGSRSEPPRAVGLNRPPPYRRDDIGLPVTRWSRTPPRAPHRVRSRALVSPVMVVTTTVIALARDPTWMLTTFPSALTAPPWRLSATPDGGWRALNGRFAQPLVCYEHVSQVRKEEAKKP